MDTWNTAPVGAAGPAGGAGAALTGGAAVAGGRARDRGRAPRLATRRAAAFPVGRAVMTRVRKCLSSERLPRRLAFSVTLVNAGRLRGHDEGARVPELAVAVALP